MHGKNDLGSAEQATQALLPPGLGAQVATPPFAEVYDQCFEFVVRSARRLGVPESQVDDVVQDVFVTVHRRLDGFEGRSQIKTWVFGILRHTVRDLRRGQRRKPATSLEHEPEAPDNEGPDAQAARSEGWKLLYGALESLSEDQREVFVLAELEQMSSPEIASALSLNLNTVYSRLRSARLAFETALKRLRSQDEWRMR